MSAQSGHGRRRALRASKPPRLPIFHEAVVRVRGQRLGVAAAVTGMIALTALSAAHADLGAGVRDGAAVSVLPVAEAPVSASPGAVLTFDSPAVTSQPAPAPAQPAQPAGAVAAPVPVVTAAEAAPSVASRGLRAPLASMNVSSAFGFRVSPITGAAAELHTGIDLTGACSTGVFAAGAGKIIEAGWSPYGSGNRIVVEHGNGLKTTYNHLASIGVSLGQAVAQGELIAGVGTTGASTGCHLHFEVLVNDVTVDPSSYI
ncbi:M23 family metallopeptidase [Pseudarthrobacter sp. CC4]|uniref:M23 family metallopeptidase n=1 Tax=Pseudarthrobacter sp. CC4 TaxID=3029190 RepID=UPI003B8E3DAA